MSSNDSQQLSSYKHFVILPIKHISIIWFINICKIFKNRLFIFIFTIQYLYYPSKQFYGSVANKGNVMPPHFTKVDLKINTAKYIKFIQTVMLPRIKKNSNTKKPMSIQDSVPTQRVKTTQNFLKEVLYQMMFGIPAHLI